MTATLPAAAVGKALSLVGAVREYDALSVSSLLTHSSRDDLYAVAVALASMVDAESSPSELLRWNDGIDATLSGGVPRERRGLAPHGTHSAFNRHRSNGEYPCPDCWEGERSYQRNRLRVRRSRTVEAERRSA